MSDVLFGFLALALVVALVLFFVVAKFAARPQRLNRAYYTEQWQRITRLGQGSEAEWHMAIFEADKLLDHALKARGLRGQTMGERLKSARSRLSNNNAVWQAHKLRNRLAHESGTGLRQNEVQSALSGFASGLKDLGAL